MDQPVLHSLDFRLSYGECDPAGIVYYAAFYPWFERAYTEWNHQGGFPSNRMRELWGASHISVASGCEYRIPGKLHDPFTVKMRLRHVGTTSWSLAFDVDHRDNGQTYATGHLVSVFVDESDPPRPVPVPEGLRTVLREHGCVL